MSRQITELLQPLDRSPLQTYLGKGLHTLGLIGWILEQTGPSQVYVSTFSTSDAFLSGFLRLRKKGLVKHAVLMADLKASRKTVALSQLMEHAFDDVFLAQNHSKIVLVTNGRMRVSSISSQNQTYGDRAECTVVTTDPKIWDNLYASFARITEKAILLNGLFDRIAQRNREESSGNDDSN
jgi:hypothetical protein